MTTLSLDTLALLLRFLETRYDALCEYLVDDEGIYRRTVRDEADALLAAVRRAERWAQVPAPLRPGIAEVIKTARRMWEVDGRDIGAVRRHVFQVVPLSLRQFVLEEAYRDAPLAATRAAGATVVEVVRDERDFEVAYVVQPPVDALAEDADVAAEIAADRAA